MAPKHKNPSNARRTAVAPYNFVSVPDGILSASSQVNHSAYHGNRLTGWIDVTLETRSPVYVRGPLTPTEHRQMEREENDSQTPHLNKLRNKPDFFHTGDPNAPAIPGSSLRGMLRTLAQILGYGKLAPVSNAPLIYRAVADMSSHGDAYRARLMAEVTGQKNHYIPRFKGGYMHKENGDWHIRAAQEWGGVTYARLSRRNIPGKLKNWRNCRNASIVYIEPGPYDFQKVRGGFIHIKYANVLRVMANDAPGLKMAVLAQSGKMFQKNSEAIVFAPDEKAKLIPVPDKLVTAYRDQISPEQERLLGKTGVLRQDQPVFYLVEDGTLTFFGHTRMFRMPYPYSPQEMLSPAHGDDKMTDYAEAIFGSAKGENTGVAGRVFVSDAQMSPEQASPWLSGDPVLIPEILSGPKPTTFQHYLTQSNPDAAKGQGLHTYNDKSKNATLRGFKMYWHKGDASRRQIAEKGKVDPVKDTQHTKMKPVRSGVAFKFRVYYENLLRDELGLLWWTLTLPAEGDYCHKLGMGKPLGMGAVKLTPKLVIVNPPQRYKSLLATDGSAWNQAFVPPDRTEAIRDEAVARFEKRVTDLVKQPNERFNQLGRVQELLTMLSWPGPQPPQALTRYMQIEYPDPKAKRGKRNEYRERPVLPTPQGVMTESGKVKAALDPRPQRDQTALDYQTGRVKMFRTTYGFIKPDDGGPDVFVHRNQLTGGLSVLLPDQRVRFRIGPGRKGPQALDVSLDD